MDPDTVLTDAALDEFLGGQALDATTLLPDAWTDLRPARQYALDVVLDRFKRMSPPVLETDIVDPTELADAVQLGAAMRLYRLAMTTGDRDEIFADSYHEYKELFELAIEALSPTLASGEVASTIMTIELGRR